MVDIVMTPGHQGCITYTDPVHTFLTALRTLGVSVLAAEYYFNTSPKPTWSASLDWAIARVAETLQRMIDCEMSEQHYP
jgi:hypothetical protein